MPEMTEYPPGFATWIELASPDLEASKRFYCELFGWYVYTMTANVGEYDMLAIGDVQGPEIGGMQLLADDSQRSSWAIYFRSDDLPSTLGAVGAAGGQELFDPTDIAHLGRMALCGDAEGADFSLWLPYELRGAGVVNEPSAMCWIELACRDAAAARRFYGAVFGWKAVEREHGSIRYTHWELGGRSVGGMVVMDERWPADFPSHWIPYIGVADCDASAARAVELGARIQVPPADSELGRFCIMTDPAGARLGIVRPSPSGRYGVLGVA